MLFTSSGSYHTGLSHTTKSSTAKFKYRRSSGKTSPVSCSRAQSSPVRCLLRQDYDQYVCMTSFLDNAYGSSSSSLFRCVYSKNRSRQANSASGSSSCLAPFSIFPSFPFQSSTQSTLSCSFMPIPNLPHHGAARHPKPCSSLS
jgi:hypothetical protein